MIRNPKIPIRKASILDALPRSETAYSGHFNKEIEHVMTLLK